MVRMAILPFSAMNMCYCTIDDIYNLPEGQRAELIDGELYMMATPDRIHQKLVVELSFRISDYTGLKFRKPLVC